MTALVTKSERQEAFLAAIAQRFSISAAARLVGVTRGQHYVWKREDPEYVVRYEHAQQEALDGVVDQVFQIATGKVTKKVVSAGREIGEELDQMAVLRAAEILLRAHRPEQYRDRSTVEHTGRDGGPIELAAVARERLSSEIARLAPPGGAAETS